MANLSKITDGAHIYLRPIGFLYGGIAAKALGEGTARPLAGTGIAFTGLEIIQRLAGGAIDRQLMNVSDWPAWQAALPALQQARLTAVFARLQEARPGLDQFAGGGKKPPLIMGIVNVTPDSFSDGGRYLESDVAIAQGARLVAAGADILDIGGVSTRPGAEPVPVDEEMSRVLPVVEGLKDLGVPLSVDTTSAAVMREAARLGATIINDVSALTAEEMSLAAARDTGAVIVLMHAQGDSRNMQKDPRYDDVLLDVYDYLEGRVEACQTAGVARGRLALDPGIGFGKTLEHNLALLSGLSLFHGLGLPLLLGVSRKSFIARLSGQSDPAARVPGSLAAQLQAISQGCQIIRVHDVAEMAQAKAVFCAIMQAG